MQRVFFSLEHRWLIRGAQVQRIFSQEAWSLNMVKWPQAKIHRDQSWYLSQVLLLRTQSQGELEENNLTLCPWCQRGRNERHIVINAKGGDCWRYGYNRRLKQMVKIVIDGNRLFMEHAQEMLEHRSWNTDAETQSQMLAHRCWNTDTNAATQEMTKTGSRIVIDGNQLDMEQTQVLEHKCWNIEARR